MIRRGPGRPRHPELLTPREQEVLLLLRDDLTNDQIAERLGISRDGAKYHVSQIISKLGVRSRHQAAAWRPDVPQRRFALLALLDRLPGFAVAGAAVVAGLLVVAALGALSFGIIEMRGRDSEPDSEAPALSGGHDITQIAFAVSQGDESDVWIMNADGTNRRQLTNTPGREFPLAWSPDGQLLALQVIEDKPPTRKLAVIKPDGTGFRIVFEDPGMYGAYWSPDGQRFAFESSRLGNLNIFVINLDGTGLTTITNDSRVNAGPQWSPDGRTLMFGNAAGLNLVDADGTHARLVIAQRAVGSWSPDGKQILYVTQTEGKNSLKETIYMADIGFMNADGTGARLVKAGLIETGVGGLSPDGSKISLVTGSSIDDFALLVMNADGTGLRQLTRDTFVQNVQWSLDSRALIYVRAVAVRRFVMERQLCVVMVDGSSDACLPNKYIDNEDGDQMPVWRFN